MYRGNQLYRLKRYEEAITAFDEAIKQKPEFIHLAYYGKGLALFYLYKDTEALTNFQQATQANPDFVAAWHKQSAVYRELKKWDLALTAIDKAISLDAKNPNLYLQKHTVLLRLEHYREALTAIEMAIKLAPRATYFNDRGIVYRKLKEYQKAIDDYNLAIKIDPNYAQPYNNRGNIYYYDLKEYQKALSDYTDAIKIDPNLAGAYHQRGYVYEQLKEYQKAIDDYTNAIKIDPNFVMAYVSRGAVYHKLKEYEKAISDYTDAIKIDPNFVMAYSGRVVTYSAQIEFQKALVDAEKAAELFRQQGDEAGYQTMQEFISGIKQKMSKLGPKDAQDSFDQGVLYVQLKEYEKAISFFTLAIEIDKNFADAYMARGVILYAVQGEFKKALADAEKAAELFRQQGNQAGYQEAQELISSIKQDMSKLDSKDAQAYFDQGFVYAQLKEYEKAIAYFTEAIKIDKNFADAYMARGVILYAVQGEFKKALADAEKAAELKRR